MNDYEINLKLLLDITNKKKKVLEQILNLTDNQTCIIDSSDLNKSNRDMFNMLGTEKQKLIDEVLKLDTVFERIFNKIVNVLENNELPKEEKLIVKKLQNLIEEVVTLDTKICKGENENSDKLTKIKDKVALEETKKETSTISKAIPMEKKSLQSLNNSNKSKSEVNISKVSRTNLLNKYTKNNGY